MRIEELILDKDLSKLDTIQRWGMNQVIRNENVTQHSFWVSFYATCLSEELYPDKDLESVSMKLDIIRYALMHDLDEIFSGDIGHTVKNNVVNGDKLKEILDEYISNCVVSKFNSSNRFNEMMIKTLLPNKMNEKCIIIKHIVKICDWMSFIKYLDLEISVGNHSVMNVRDYCSDNIKSHIENTKLLDIPNKEVLDQLIRYV